MEGNIHVWEVLPDLSGFFSPHRSFAFLTGFSKLWQQEFLIRAGFTYFWKFLSTDCITDIPFLTWYIQIWQGLYCCYPSTQQCIYIIYQVVVLFRLENVFPCIMHWNYFNLENKLIFLKEGVFHWAMIELYLSWVQS